MEVAGAIEYTNKLKLRFTRTTVAYNATDATKNSQCSAELGALYTGAQLLDVGFNQGAVGNIGGQYTGGNNVARYGSTTAGTYPLACVHK